MFNLCTCWFYFLFIYLFFPFRVISNAIYYLDKLKLCLNAILVSLIVTQILLLYCSLTCHSPVDVKFVFHDNLKCSLSIGRLASTYFSSSESFSSYARLRLIFTVPELLLVVSWTFWLLGIIRSDLILVFTRHFFHPVQNQLKKKNIYFRYYRDQ